MTREEFIKVLEEKGYTYKIEGDKIVVTRDGYVNLGTLGSIPPGVEFKNAGNVYLGSLRTIPPGVVFNNRGDVGLRALKALSPGVEFNNNGIVFLNSLKTLPPDVVFNNLGDILVKLGWIGQWSGNIEDIDSKRLLNLMIKKELFI